MPDRLQKPAQRRVLVTFLFFLPFTLLVILTVLLFALSSALRTSNKWVQHTLEVKNAVRNIFGHLLEAESAARGFLLMHDASFLEDEEVATRAQADLQRIQRLTEDNKIQQQSVLALQPLVRAKLDSLAQLIALQKQNRGNQARQTSNEGKGLMEKIRPILVAMENEEDRLLELREARAESHSRLTRVLATALLLIDMVALGAIALLLHRAKRLQQLVTVCAWTKTIQHEGRWVSFEEYLRQRFGISVTHSISRTAYDKLQAEVNSQSAQAA